MELESVRPMVLRGTFHVYELASFAAAARYVVDTAPADVPAEVIDQLATLLAEYDRQVRGLRPSAGQPH
ncbi:hypothetical protein [Kitasatospora sp. NBC_01266]|uniref:hypothetical protein n=1 Tax=Kitasatospora sp. NBC_01266 TaxID=2903572 RepID=UPI002E34278E|nr:hypothetical protein [Kitasatospora sp. NBC_01266]